MRIRAALGALGGAGVAMASLLGCSGDAEAPPVAASDVVAGCESSTDEGAPKEIRCTGLYTDVATKAIAPRARAYEPATSFWSDGAEKHRYIDLPDGAQIDTSSMDDWRLPVGTKLWKEIQVGGRRIETRYFHKVREGRWLQAAYVWTPDQSNAIKADGADLDLGGGATYHVPKSSECNDCHRGRQDKVLGFEAVSLGRPGASGWTLAALATEGRLSAPPVVTTATVADDATGKSAAASAWLHVNCGISCHTGTPQGTGYGSGLVLRLGWSEVTTKPPSEWAMSKSTIGVPIRTPKWAGESRIVPGDPSASVLYRLLAQRGGEQMPPIATKVVDDVGRAAVEAWISAMPKAESPPGIDPDVR
ncbi:MAG: hypothetical protein JST00_36205 [Deltaproteobacteria bacterium]|nr:hypothetical protein [Deltaproteobacteria bacterium]